MIITRFLFPAAFVAVTAIAQSQALPPPAFAGQSYWFGPGPQSYTATYHQDYGGYAEFIKDPTAGWQLTASGGTGLQSANDQFATFFAETFLTIQSYIYVDGYFDVVANLNGIGAGTVTLGTSRFFVVHNCPIEINTPILDNIVRISTSEVLPTVYHLSAHDYANPGNFSVNQDVNGGSPAGSFDQQFDPSQDEGILQFDITREVTIPQSTLSGSYYANGQIVVQAL